MKSFATLSLLVLVAAAGCTHFSVRRDRFIEVKDQQLVNNPYVQQLVEKVAVQWDPPSPDRQMEKIYRGTIIDVTVSINVADGAVAATKLDAGAGFSQIPAESMCTAAIRRAAPFGEVPKDLAPKAQDPLEVVLSFHY